MSLIYFDHAATTNVNPLVESAYFECIKLLGNSASIHKHGQIVKNVLETAREQVADFFKVTPLEILFTSGGTESNNLAIKGIFWQQIYDNPQKRKIIVNTAEHHSVLDTVEFLEKFENAEVIKISPDKNGIISAENFTAILAEYNPDEIALAIIMQANNETGVINPINELAAISVGNNIPIVVDGVAAIGHSSFDLNMENIAAYSVSGHKFGTPLGIGVLYLNRNITAIPLIHGGGQERKLRAGTVNVPGAVAMAKALDLVKENKASQIYLSELRDYFESNLLAKIPNVVITGNKVSRLANVSNIIFPGSSADSMLLLLDNAGISVSTGSACTAGVTEPSHVLISMGISTELASNALRFSFANSNTKEEIDYLLSKLPEIVYKSQ